MNAFKRRRDSKTNALTSQSLSDDAKIKVTKPTFESIVQRVMRMRISEGVKPNNESPPDIPIKGATIAKSPFGEREQNVTNQHHHHRSTSHRRVISK